MNDHRTFGDLVASRIDNWQEPTAEQIAGHACTIEHFGHVWNRAPAIVLTWLKGGMPFLKAGNWQTGEGFELHFWWASDWLMLMRDRAKFQHDVAAGRILDLP